MGWKQTGRAGIRWQLILTAAGAGVFFSFPAILYATHEADHRFTVEGFVCGTDGKGSPNVEVLVKDTRLSYGQTVTTDADGFYKAKFHLHNNNLGDPLLVEARGEQQNHKVQFDPEDLESERKIQVNFGKGCIADPSTPPEWVLAGVVVAIVGVGGFVGMKLLRAWRKNQARREKGQSKKKK
ncbi:MAG: carboxypeptidase-like regulatory domain-containing protein [Nitrospiraceae bacterium]